LIAEPGVTFPRTHSPPPSHGYQNLDPSSANTPPGPTSYSSDISSLTPSQSISQRAGASIEAEPIREPSDSPIATRKPEDEIFYQGHVTISLPPAHAISELELPTGVRTPPPTSTPASTSTSVPTPLHAVPNGSDVDSKQNTCIPGTGPRRARSQQRRPVSTRISEVSNEDAHQDEERTANVPSPSAPIRPTSFRNNSSTIVAGGIATRRSESSDDALEGPLEVVENDPFASIRSKSISLRVPPDTDGGHGEIPSPGLAKGKPRERKVSSTFLGSLRGLFRTRGRTKGMDSPSAVWEGPVVAEPRSPKGTNGWVTRIDGHLRTRRDSSDSEGGTGNRRESGARSKLRKGRGSPTNAASPWGKNISSGSTPTRANTSGWLTDSGGGQGVVRGKSKRRKKSIAALKGPEAGFTDGEVEHEVEREKGRHSIDVYPPSHTNVAQRDKASQARPQIAPSPSLTKGVVPFDAEEAASARAKRNRRATADLSNMGSSGNMLDTGLQAPRSRRSSTILSGPSETSLQTSAKPPNQQIPQQLQPSSTSGAPKGRRGAKPGILHTPNGSADQSLMSIVEDVARQNRERRLTSTQAVSNGHDNLTGRELPTLELPRAPSLRAPQATVPGISTHDGWFGRLPNGSTRSLDVPHTRSAASPSLPASLATAITSKVHDGSMSDTAAPTRAVTSSTHLSRPAKSPFPSALRNISRTPSPNPVPVTKSTGAVRETGINTQSLNGAIAEPDQPRGRPLERVLVANRMSLTYDPRDSMSISSYETGRESPMSSSPSPSPLPQPLSLLPQSSSQTPTARSPPSRDHDQAGTSSTASGDTPTTRRKSVRVSLQPTFSPAPPAEYDQFDEDDEDETGGRHVSWSSRSKRVSGAATHDVWQDSSEEDEEYRRARQLLSRAGKRKGKA